MTKKERREAERKLIVAAALTKIAKRLEKEAEGVDLPVGGHPLNFQLTVEDSTVNVGLPTTGKQGYQFGPADVLHAALYNIKNADQVVVWAIDTLKESKADADLASELKAYAKIVKDQSEGRQAKLKLRTPPTTSRGSRTATIAGLLLEGHVGSEEFSIDLAGDA
jgi:hypothetical protein